MGKYEAFPSGEGAEHSEAEEVFRKVKSCKPLFHKGLQLFRYLIGCAIFLLDDDFGDLCLTKYK